MAAVTPGTWNLQEKESQWKKWLIPALGILALFGQAYAYESGRKLEAEKDSSFITYHVYHVFHSVDAVSRQVSCEVEIDSSTHRIVSVTASVKVRTFDSGNEARDRTAMKAIESEKYPVVTFQSDSVRYYSETKIVASGRLTFHGVEREIALPVTLVSSGNELVCDGSIRLDFDAYRVDRPSLIFIPIGDTLLLSFHIVFIRQL